ncbi:MAG: flagellar basal body L-ring protein FlgH [Betaproteobacteria bacterium]|nr:flagellar basal body L-ring protein FlgH [Betaproteobacteria bacterium]
MNSLRPIRRPLLWALLATGLLGGCMSPPKPDVLQPMTALPKEVSPPPSRDGAIYQPGYGRLALFEDRRARHVGDIITILIAENMSATSSGNSSAQRSGDTEVSVPTISGVLGKTFQGMAISGTDATKFAGQGATSSSNVFTGSIGVTVIRVLANGDLVVSGQKELAIGQRTEYIRFSGVVNPADITAQNTVASTQVADVTLEDRGRGYIDEAQVMPWLSRIFMSVLPF